MMCTTVLHGGVCHRTSTPHKSGNNMKEKKKFELQIQLIQSIMNMFGKKQQRQQLINSIPGVQTTLYIICGYVHYE